jgi:hypothetical protein
MHYKELQERSNKPAGRVFSRFLALTYALYKAIREPILETVRIPLFGINLLFTIGYGLP